MQATTWETQRLRCRPIARGDLASLEQLYSDPSVMRYLGTGQPLSSIQTAERLQTYLEAWAQAGFGSYALVLKTMEGFEQFSLERIFARADVRNGASIRVMQKADLTLVSRDENAVEYAIVRSRS